MKKSSTSIFTLLSRMTKGEKRYFHLSNSPYNLNKKKSNYVRLYEAMEKQEVADEEEIRSLFKEEKWFKNYSVVKSQLYNMLIESLITYNLKNHQKEEADKDILKAKLLFKKGLYEDAIKFINRLKINFKSQERFIDLIRLYEIEDDVYVYYKPYEDYFNETQLKIQEKEIILKKYLNLLACRSNFRLLGERLARLEISTLESSIDYLEKHQQILDKLEAEALSKRALRQVYKTQLYLYLAFNNPLKALSYQIKIKELTEDLVELKALPPEYLAFVIINLMAMEIKMNITTNFDLRIKELKELEKKVDGYLEKRACILGEIYGKISYHFEAKDYKNVLKAHQKIPKDFLNDFGSTEPRLELDLIYYISYSFFVSKQFKEAEQFSLLGIQKIKEDASPHIYSDLLILNTLSLFELGKHRLLHAIAKSYKRKLELMNKLTKLNNKFFNFIQTPYTNKSRRNIALVKLFKQVKENGDLSLHDQETGIYRSSAWLIYTWLESKSQIIEHIPPS